MNILHYLSQDWKLTLKTSHVFFVIICLLFFKQNQPQTTHYSIFQQHLTINKSIEHNTRRLSAGAWSLSYVSQSFGDFDGVALSVNGQYIYAASSSGGLFLSTDFGAEFNRLPYAGTCSVVATNSSGQFVIYAASSGGRVGTIFTSNDYGFTFTQQLSSPTYAWNALAVSSNGSIIAGTPSGEGLSISYDYGVTWNQPAGVPVVDCPDVVISGNGQFMMVAVDDPQDNFSPYGILVSTTSGQYWAATNAMGISSSWISLATSSDGSVQYAITSAATLYYTYDQGDTWTKAATLSSVNSYVACTADGSSAYVTQFNPNSASLVGGFIYISTDAGNTWTKMDGSQQVGYTSVAVSGDGHITVASTDDNIYTFAPSTIPTSMPSSQPSRQPSRQPTGQPTGQPSRQPSGQPTRQPTSQPSSQPNRRPSSHPSCQPTSSPSTQPSRQPGSQPSSQPLSSPSGQPVSRPSMQPSSRPSSQPTTQPNTAPSSMPSTQPSSEPSVQPSSNPSSQPSAQPVLVPTFVPSTQPSSRPTTQPTGAPTNDPSGAPQVRPTSQPSSNPSVQPSMQPNSAPSSAPSVPPTSMPSSPPSFAPNVSPSAQPSSQPSSQPSAMPSLQPSNQPQASPTSQPSSDPSTQPSAQPSGNPSAMPSSQPSLSPSTQPSSQPSGVPSTVPQAAPTGQPSSAPSGVPSAQPSSQPSCNPSSVPSSEPTAQPECLPGQYYQFSADGYECIACPVGTYSSGVTQFCTDCAAGSYSTGAECLLCPTNTYSTTQNSNACTTCALGLTNSGIGNTLKSSCVNPMMNFAFAFLALGMCLFAMSLYIVGGRLHRMSFVRRERLVRKSIVMCNMVFEQLLFIGRQCREIAAREAERKRNAADQTTYWRWLWVTLFIALIVTVVVLFAFVSSVLRVFFTALILWRGYTIVINVSFVDRITQFIGSIANTLHIPFLGLVFYPFVYLINALATLNISLDSVNVTCLGSQIPMHLLIDCVVVGVVVIIVQSDMEVYWCTALENVHNEFRSVLLQKSFWHGNVYHNVKFFLWSVCLQAMPHPRKILQYGLGFVKVSVFFDHYGFGASSENCDAASGGIVGVDTLLAILSSIVAYAAVFPIVYLFSQILVPDFRLESGVVKTETYIRRHISRHADEISCCGQCGLGLFRQHTNIFGGKFHCDCPSHESIASQNQQQWSSRRVHHRVVYGCPAMTKCKWAICVRCYEQHKQVAAEKQQQRQKQRDMLLSAANNEPQQLTDSDDRVGFDLDELSETDHDGPSSDFSAAEEGLSSKSYDFSIDDSTKSSFKDSSRDQEFDAKARLYQSEVATKETTYYSRLLPYLKIGVVLVSLDWFFVKLTFVFAHSMYSSLKGLSKGLQSENARKSTKHHAKNIPKDVQENGSDEQCMESEGVEMQSISAKLSSKPLSSFNSNSRIDNLDSMSASGSQKGADNSVASTHSLEPPSLPWFYAARNLWEKTPEEQAEDEDEERTLTKKWTKHSAAFPTYYRMVLTVQEDLTPKFTHKGVTCHKCQVSPLVGRRYVCGLKGRSEVDNLSLCELCAFSLSKKDRYTAVQEQPVIESSAFLNFLVETIVVVLSWTIIGQLCSERGRQIWVRVLRNYLVFGRVTLGYWNDKVVKDYRVMDRFAQIEKDQETFQIIQPRIRSVNSLQSMQSAHSSNSVGAEVATPTAHAAESSSEVDYSHGPSLNSDEAERMQLLSALVSPRIVLIQLIPFLTLLSTLAVDVSSSPVLIFSPELLPKVPKLFETESWDKAETFLLAMGNDLDGWKVNSLGLYMFMLESRSIQCFLNVASNFIALGLVFADDKTVPFVIYTAIVLFLLLALVSAIYPIILLNKMMFQPKTSEKVAEQRKERLLRKESENEKKRTKETKEREAKAARNAGNSTRDSHTTQGIELSDLTTGGSAQIQETTTDSAVPDRGPAVASPAAPAASSLYFSNLFTWSGKSSTSGTGAADSVASVTVTENPFNSISSGHTSNNITAIDDEDVFTGSSSSLKGTVVSINNAPSNRDSVRKRSTVLHMAVVDNPLMRRAGGNSRKPSVFLAENDSTSGINDSNSNNSAGVDNSVSNSSSVLSHIAEEEEEAAGEDDCHSSLRTETDSKPYPPPPPPPPPRPLLPAVQSPAGNTWNSATDRSVPPPPPPPPPPLGSSALDDSIEAKNSDDSSNGSDIRDSGDHQ